MLVQHVEHTDANEFNMLVQHLESLFSLALTLSVAFEKFFRVEFSKLNPLDTLAIFKYIQYIY